MSMAAGEYVSVSTQRDSERALLDKERRELARSRRRSWPSWPGSTSARGSATSSPARSPRELTAHDALGAHAEAELGIDPDDLTNPWHAAWASMVAFTVGALLPLLTIVLVPAGARVAVTGRRGGPRAGRHRLGQRDTGLEPARAGGAAQRRAEACWRWS